MSEFRTVTNTADLAPGDMKLVNLDGEEIAIANVDGEYFAFNNTCPHAGGPLAEGELEGDIVTCPWHSTPLGHPGHQHHVGQPCNLYAGILAVLLNQDIGSLI